MAPTPPILSTSEDLNLPDLERVLNGSAIPSSADLSGLNDSLAALSAAAQARVNALIRDLELLHQTYAPLRQKVNSERALETAAASQNDEAIIKQEITLQTPAEKKRKIETDTVLDSPHGSISRQHSHTPLDLTQYEQVQTLPPSLLARSEDLETLKRKLGVAYFPTQDLSHLLPGIPSTEDFTKQKIPNQIAVNTFQASIEPFFRPFTEEDLGWLRDRGDRLNPFLIPPLGTHYTEVWNETVEETASLRQEVTQRPRESAEHLCDDNLQSDQVSCGPLTSRLLSAFIKEEGNNDNSGESEQLEKEKGARLTTFRMDYTELEDKVTGELNFIGLLDGNPVDWSQTADDEISSNLRALQKQLHAQSAVNAARKQRLMKLTTDEMAKDEYTSILDDLDKQVEQAFFKRTRSIKATKKKRAPGEKGIAVTKLSIGSNIRSLIEKRQKWIQRIGHVCTTTPVTKESIFKDINSKSRDNHPS